MAKGIIQTRAHAMRSPGRGFEFEFECSVAQWRCKSDMHVTLRQLHWIACLLPRCVAQYIAQKAGMCAGAVQMPLLKGR